MAHKMHYQKIMATLIRLEESSSDDKEVEQFRNEMIKSIDKNQSEANFWKQLGEKYAETVSTVTNKYVKAVLASDETFISKKLQQIESSKKLELTSYADTAKKETQFIYNRIVHLEENRDLKINPNRINSTIIDYMKTLDQDRKLAEQKQDHRRAGDVLSAELNILAERLKEHKKEISQSELIIGVIAGIDAFQGKLDSTKISNLLEASLLFEQITTIESMTVALGYTLWAVLQADVEDIKKTIRDAQKHMEDLKREIDHYVQSRETALAATIACGAVGVGFTIAAVVCFFFCPVFSVALTFGAVGLLATSAAQGIVVARLDKIIQQLREAIAKQQKFIDDELELLQIRKIKEEEDMNTVFNAVVSLCDLNIKNMDDIEKSLKEAMKDNCDQLQDLVHLDLIEKESIKNINDKNEIDLKISVFVSHAIKKVKQQNPLLVWDYLDLEKEKKTDEIKRIFRLVQRMVEYEEFCKKTRGEKYIQSLAEKFETEITA